MSKKEKSPMKELLDKLGIKRAPPDHPIYRTGPIIRFVSRIPKKGEDENK